MPTLENLAQGISLLCGWLYVLLWSLSFYTQPILNFQRQSTEGLAFDWPFLNVYGSACYALSTALFLFSSTVKQQYSLRHPQAPQSTIRFNDFCFGLHGLLLCSITVSQFWPRTWGWKGVGGDRKVATTTFIVFWGSLVGLALGTCIVLFRSTAPIYIMVQDWEWIDVAYILGDVKLLVTIVKYIPQIRSNYKRKSTAGLAMSGQLLDLAGGILSLLQLAIDAILQGNWSGVTGNPAKFGLANLSMLADIIFMYQHYVLYRPRDIDMESRAIAQEGGSRETDPLLK